MQAINTFFKSLAVKLSLPTFFQENGLIFNNLFLTVVAVLSLVCLLLVIFLIPTKKKAKNA